MTDELRFPTELKLWKYKIERLARRFGLDFYPIIYNIVTAQEMSEVVARSGFPTSPHHWRKGQESVWLKKRFRFGMGRIYEIVINAIPTYAYLLQLNDVITQKSVMAHVCGHADLNKNNAYFDPTNRKMLNSFASDALQLEHYLEVFGSDRVKKFYDWILSFEWFIDQNSLYIRREARAKSEDERSEDREKHKIPRRIEPREELPSYMDEFLNPPEWLEKEKKRLVKEIQAEADVERGAIVPSEPTKDVLGFLIRYAPLEPWQKDWIGRIRRQSQYFAPMARTKLMHEGWATLWQEEIMTEVGMMSSSELFQFSDELTKVQRKHGGINPYRLGYEIWKDIKFRWNTGRHGAIWEECPYRSIKDQWDEFAVFKTIVDETAELDIDVFYTRWTEFSAFVGELKAGNLGYPQEFFIRNLFTIDHLIETWLQYKNVETEYKRFERMRKEMKPLEERAEFIANQLGASDLKYSPEELRLKTRRDVYAQEDRLDLWLWTPDEVSRELAGIKPLLNFGKRWQEGQLEYPMIPVSEEWWLWTQKCKESMRLGSGNEKIFDVRATYDDLMFLEEFFTREFCEEHKYFLYKAKKVWHWTPSGSEVEKRYVIDSRSFRRIKKRLLFQYTNLYLPIVTVVDANYNNNGELYLVHEHNGVDLDYWSHDGMYIKDVLQRLFELWGNKKRVHLETIITKKADELPWWFYWHQTEEKTTEDEDRQLNGTRVLFSYGFKRISIQTGGRVEETDSDTTELQRTNLNEVTFTAPF